MDSLDRKLVGLLAANGRMSITELADELPLSISATRDRMRRLEASGLIAGFTVRLDISAVSQAIEALVDVRLGPAASTSGIDSDDLGHAGDRPGPPPHRTFRHGNFMSSHATSPNLTTSLRDFAKKPELKRRIPASSCVSSTDSPGTRSTS